MPGRHITDYQNELYMTYRKKDRPALAAARAGVARRQRTGSKRIPGGCRRTGSRGGEGARIRWRGSSRRRSYRCCWRTRLRAVALYEEMMRRHPELHPGVRRTLERRVRGWKAKHGPEREIIFRQKHEPGVIALASHLGGRSTSSDL